MTLTPGTHLGPYEILSPLGAGGMGEVYRARDTRLNRDVAIKVLPERLAKDPEALNRFEREAQAVAALSHPNILAIYDVGTDPPASALTKGEDPPASPLAKGGKRGVLYVVMELLEGETLRERVRRSAIPWRKAVEFAMAIADGLAAAHAKGIVHRDLKPENIFLTKDGVVKILDFGLAHVEPATSGDPAADQADTPTVTLDTRPGTILGTINYMSPEQVRGQRTDARSDIFSFGCVLYEMVTGRRAFTGDSPPETMTAILKQDPPDTTESGVKTVPELDRVIRRCLEKKSDQRIHSARDLGFALRDILSDSGAARPLPARGTIWAGKAVWIAVGAVVVMSAVLAYVLPWGGAGAGPRETIDSVAVKSKTGRINLVVLPFKDISPAPEAWFGDGLTETLIAQLSRLSPDRLSVIASTTAMQYKGTDKRVRQIGRELNIDYLVEGRVQRIDDRVRIFAKLVRVSDETHVWSEDFDRKIDDVFALQSEVVSRIAEGIQIQLTPTQEAQLARARPVDRDALDAYLQGLALAKDGTQQACRSALKMFDQAIEVDPSFAFAHVGRANVFVTLGEWHVPPIEAMPHAKTAALDALALDDGLPEALTALAYVQMEFEWDFPKAEKTFKRAVELNGSSTGARLGYAQYLTVMNRGDEAIHQLDWVREHDPASVYTYEHHGIVAFMARRFDRVIRDCSAAIDVDPGFWKARTWLGLAHAQRGQVAEGIHHLRKALSQSDNSPVVAAMLGSVLAVSGEPDEARIIVNELKKKERSDYVCPYELATVWIGLDDYDEAFAEMDRACDGRAACMPWLQVDPRLDPIRSDPRFDPLLRRVGFEQDYKLKLVEAAEPDPITLVVLPFEPASANPDTEYLKGEIPASIIHTLSALSGLQVIPRSTAFRFQVGDRDTAAIGRELGATAVLTGQINTRGDTLIIRAELVDVATNSQLWDEHYNRKIADIMAIEEDIAKEISEALRLQLTGEEQAQLTRRHTENAEAYQHYLQGRFWWNKRNQPAIDKAIELFKEALRIDPQYALAYAGLADSYCVLGWAYRRPSDVFPKAREAAEQAIAIDPGLAEAYPALGFVRVSYDWDWTGAEQAFERAFELNPSYSHAHQWYALFLARSGRLKEMLRQARRAQELDPGSLMANWGVGTAHFFRREYAAAVEQLKRTLEMDPDFVPAHQMLGLVYLRMKRYDDAIGVYLRLHERGGRVPANAGQLGLVYAVAGRRTEALDELRILEDIAKERYMPPTAFALIHGGLGDMDEAFRWMDRAVEQRDRFLTLLNSPTFDELRGDTRFDVLLRRIALPPSALNESSAPSERPQ